MQYTPETKHIAKQILEQFDKLGISVEPHQIAEMVEAYHTHRGLPPDAVHKHVSDIIRQQHAVSRGQYTTAGETPKVHSLRDIYETNWTDKPVSVKLYIDEVADMSSPHISQVAMGTDATEIGENQRCKITVFDESQTQLKIGGVYHITNAVTSEFNDQLEIVVNSVSCINTVDNPTFSGTDESDESDVDTKQIGETPTTEYNHSGGFSDTDESEESDVSTPQPPQPDKKTVLGRVVNIDSSTGIVDGCSVVGCKPVLEDGEICDIHGYIPEADRRKGFYAKLSVDTDTTTSNGVVEVVLHHQLIHEITTLTLEEALKLKKDHPTSSPVRDYLIHELLDRDVEVTYRVDNNVVFELTPLRAT